MRIIFIVLVLFLIIPIVQAAPESIIIENSEVKFSFVHNDGEIYLDEMVNKKTGKIFESGFPILGSHYPPLKTGKIFFGRLRRPKILEKHKKFPL